MGRNIVVCLDGTDNKYNTTNTNVVKLYAMLDRTNSNQIAYYQTGIGTFAPPGTWNKLRRWLITRLDLAVAWLLEDHVTDAYRFLMDHYQDGDDIYIFGFSRGAFSARVLAAMLYKVGLLGEGNEELLPFAWDIFNRKHSEEGTTQADGFRHTFGRRIPVKFLGVWDTVSSVGWAWSPKHFEFTAHNPAVQVFRHAVALDERRADFLQNLWSQTPPLGQDAVEVWFPGVHCDVGGGYAELEAGLSKIALQWMLREAKSRGLRFNADAEVVIIPPTTTHDYAAPDPLARKHESLEGLWWIAEVIPKQIKDPENNWAPRWIIPWGRHRHVKDGVKIHSSVLERMRGIPTYLPQNLPMSRTIID